MFKIDKVGNLNENKSEGHGNEGNVDDEDAVYDVAAPEVIILMKWVITLLLLTLDREKS